MCERLYYILCCRDSLILSISMSALISSVQIVEELVKLFFTSVAIISFFSHSLTILNTPEETIVSLKSDLFFLIASLAILT